MFSFASAMPSVARNAFLLAVVNGKLCGQDLGRCYNFCNMLRMQFQVCEEMQFVSLCFIALPFVCCFDLQIIMLMQLHRFERG